MDAADLRDLLKIAPFRPITLDAGRGRQVTIHDPALTLLSQRTIIIGEKVHEGIVDKLHTVDLSRVRGYEIVDD